MPYLNLRTGEYPRFKGDVALARNDKWEFVEPTTPPVLGERQLLAEGAPEKDSKGAYRQTWIVTTLTETEWEARRLDVAKKRLAAFGLTPADLQQLLTEEA